MQPSDVDAVKKQMTDMLEKTQNKQPRQQNKPTEIQSTRLPFDAEFFSAAKKFAENSFESIPELRAVAIVPIFKPQPSSEDAVTGLLHGRDPNEPQTGVIIRALQRISVFSAELDRTLFQQLREYDRFNSDILMEIGRRKAELANLNKPAELDSDKTQE